MAVVAFDESKFKARYPEFVALDPTLLAAYFDEACIYVSNTDSSVIEDVGVRSAILNMIVAHIAALQDSQLVGRVSFVNVGGFMQQRADYAAPTGSRAWYDQTRYGASAWNAMSAYRHAIYVVPED